MRSHWFSRIDTVPSGHGVTCSKRNSQCRRKDCADGGFTLIELIIVVTILPLVVGALGAGLLAVFSLQSNVSSRLTGSEDNQTVQANYTRYVQGATSIYTTTSPLCGPTTAGVTQLLGLEWNGNLTVVSYVTVLSGTTYSLIREYCASGPSTTPTQATTISSNVVTGGTSLAVCTAPVLSCAVASGQSWTTAAQIASSIAALKLMVTENLKPDYYSYTLVAIPELGMSTTGALGSISNGPTCGFALPGTGTYASTLCFVGFSASIITAAENAGGTSMSVAVPGGYTMTFNLAITTSGTIVASQFPTYSAAFLGNDIGGTPFYSGVGCPDNDPTTSIYNGVTEGTYSCINPAIYQTSSGATSTVTLSSIVVTDPQGSDATGYEVVTADAETTDPSEYLIWNSQTGGLPFSQIPDTSTSTEGDACDLEDSNGNPLAGGGDLTFTPTVNPTQVECQSTWQTPASEPRTGAVLLGISPPTTLGVTMPVTISASMHGAGLQGVSFGLLLP